MGRIRFLSYIAGVSSIRVYILIEAQAETDYGPDQANHWSCRENACTHLIAALFLQTSLDL